MMGTKRKLLGDGLRTWTVNTSELSCVVTAETVAVAIAWIARETGKVVKPAELIPMVRTSRHVRVLRIGEDIV